MKTQILAGLALLAALLPEEIDFLAASLPERVFQPGELLLREGGSSGHFFIQLDGEVEVFKALGTPDERLVAVRQGGTLLGEMSLFSRQGRHTASARARTAVSVLEISRAEFDALLKRRPEVAIELVSVVSQRLESSENDTIRELREKNRQLTQAYEELKAAQAELIEKRMVQRELEIAANLQVSILPHELPRRAGYDFGALMIPARMVGGDFYDFIPLGPQRLGVVVGDVCDKGIPAALFMTLTYTAMRDEAQRHADPGGALRAVNRRLAEINASEMYVTLLYGVLDDTTREFRYARAGHPGPLVLTPRQAPRQNGLRPGQPVGIFDELALDEQTLAVPAGSTLLLFSDGLSESLEQRGVFELGELASSFLDRGEVSSQGLCQQLWEAIHQANPAAAPLDDFTVLAIRGD